MTLSSLQTCKYQDIKTNKKNSLVKLKIVQSIDLKSIYIALTVFFSRHRCLIFIKFVYHYYNCIILLNLQGEYTLLTMHGTQHLVLFAHFYKVFFTCLLWFTDLHRLLPKLHMKQIFVSFFWLVVVFKVWNYWSQFLVTQWPFFTHKM